MSKQELLSMIIQGAAAVGTITVAIVAIWGDWIRLKLAPPKLTIENHNLRGKVTQFTGGKKVIFYHLKVKNHRIWTPAKNCRVLLTQVLKKGPDGNFRPTPMSVPMQLIWAPAELTPPSVTLVKEQVVDFGYIEEGSNMFTPRLYSTPNDFAGFVEKDGAVRYCCEVVSDNYVSKEHVVIEVSWNGDWSDNLDKMADYLVIKIV